MPYRKLSLVIVLRNKHRKAPPNGGAFLNDSYNSPNRSEVGGSMEGHLKIRRGESRVGFENTTRGIVPAGRGVFLSAALGGNIGVVGVAAGNSFVVNGNHCVSLWLVVFLMY